MLDLAENLNKVNARIRLAEAKYQRAVNSVHLLAVSKTKPLEMILALADAGQKMFGESYVQEAVDKISKAGHSDLEWHFIGPIQSNKTKLIAANFSWVHSVDRVKIAQRLSDQRPRQLPDLNICIQVNISGEQSKSGVSVAEVPDLIQTIAGLPRLTVRGLMAIPLRTTDFDEQRVAFRQLKLLQQQLNQQHNYHLDTLSMGMSADLEAAIAEGATHVRVGTDLFGAREYNK